MKRVCKTCGYWTRNSKDKKLKCYAGDCPAKLRDSNGWTKPGKVYYVPRQTIIRVPYCPNCNKPIQVVEDMDARTIMIYHCNNCNYSE